jgi:4-amino-4-deoxy-L-arabinose transferase-like glycosyltransferase
VAAGARRGWQAPSAILAAALATRVAYVLLTPHYVPLHDDRAFDRLALGIARTGVYPKLGWFPTAYRPPGFSYVLGMVYAVTGDGHARIVAGRLFQAVVGTAIVAVLGALALRLLDRRVAIWTMAIAAVYPPLIAVGDSLLSEAQTVLLETAALLAVLAWRSNGRIRWAAAAGALGGALTLTRSNAFVVIIAVAVGLWTSRPKVATKRRLEAQAAMLASAVAVVAPWTIRNAVVMRSFIPVSDELGGTLAGTYNPVSAHDRAAPAFWHLLNQIQPYAKATSALSRGPEPAFQSRLVRLAAGYMYHHPLYLATVAWYNTLRILDLTGSSQAHFMATVAGIRSPRVADATVYALWAVLALAVFGFAHRSVRRRIPAYIWVAAGLLFATVVLVNGEAPRLRIPIDPFILLLAGAGAPLLVDVIVRPVDARLRGRHTSFRGGGTPPDRVAG